MAGAAVSAPPRAVDYADVQGVVRFGYKHLTEACYLLLRIRDASAARAWLRDAPVTSAAELPQPPTSALQVAFTAPGLRALGVPDRVVSAFSFEFVGGLGDDESRSRRIGDVGANAPSGWRWGVGDNVPDAMVMLFAVPGHLAEVERNVKTPAFDAAFALLRRLDTSDLGGVEPFGFVDGISQPKLDWDRKRNTVGDQLDFSNEVALGEFLLGYPNEYTKYTERPLVDDDRSSAALAAAADTPSKKDVGLNGTYLVVRELEQDVRGFRQFLDQHARDAGLEPPAFGAALVGRAFGGETAMPRSKDPIPGIGPDPDEIRLNQFTYDDDPVGVKCPVGSHVRRANPRNADYAGRPAGILARLVALFGFGPHGYRDDVMSPTRFHRILRRGREYGPGLTATEALQPAPPGDPERGLHFMCVNANISRQFEFLQNAWAMSTKFDCLTTESDPLLGNREPIQGCPDTGNFTVPRDGAVRGRVSGMPQFVTVRGGAYFFLPSLRALRYFAATGASS
jgi:deferrochelatase/peroxidase EfeB